VARSRQSSEYGSETAAARRSRPPGPKLLRFHHVGLEDIADRVWSVFFGPVFLGWLDEDDYRIMEVQDHRRRC
jgi:hypothetical protein